MGANISVLSLTRKANGAVTEKRFVGFDGAQITTQGAKVMGVAQYSQDDGKDLALDVCGTAIVETGGSVSEGDGVISDASGRAITGAGEIAVESGGTAVQSTAADGNILTGGELPEYVAGEALGSADGAGEFIEILLRR